MYRLPEINKLYSQYIANPEYVYDLRSDKWLVIMKKLPDTKTNEGRKGVVDAMHGTYRANKLEVVIGFNIENPTQTMDCGKSFRDIKLEYTTSQAIIMSDKFDPTLDAGYGAGIRYFKSIERAYYQRSVPDGYTGPWILWEDSGRKECQVSIVERPWRCMIL